MVRLPVRDQDAMIPAFDEHGYLPTGIHPATLAEIAERFGQSSELRRVQMESLGWLVDLAKRAGVKRLILNGSFVTDAMEPNDIDCVLLVAKGFAPDKSVREELALRLPFIDLDIVEQEDFEYFVNTFYASDHLMIPKGMVEIVP